MQKDLRINLLYRVCKMNLKADTEDVSECTWFINNKTGTCGFEDSTRMA